MTEPHPIDPVAAALPRDADRAHLVGRVWDPAAGGPTPVLVVDGRLRDLSGAFATVSDLFETADPVAAARTAAGRELGTVAEAIENTPLATRDPARPWLLSPVDLQVLKAAGVTFAVSMIERVIEERVRGDQAAAAEMRERITAALGSDLDGLVPGSPEAHRLKEYLIAEGMWSQYLEVGIGDDAEIFTKGAVLSSVGHGADVGVLSSSTWSNPEPEVALAVASTGRVVGATLGNDVNLRDVEGRSALLLPQAKDNNASCALGPFVRLFDEHFGMDEIASARVEVRVVGTDGFELKADSDMGRISRHPASLVEQAIGRHHQYPDGFVLMLGTMFAPIQDRDEPGRGFTHHGGDMVAISSPALGTLVNRVLTSEECEPWTFGVRALVQNLADRGLLAPGR